MPLPPRSFYGLSRLILGAQLVRSHRVGYMEVEVLDWRTGRAVHVMDKVGLDACRGSQWQCPGWHPSRTGLQAEPNGPLLRDTCELRTLTSSSLLTLYSTDLGRQVGWRTVFLSQDSGPLLIYLLLYLRLWRVCGGEKTPPAVVHLACFCHSLHYIKHLLETLFVHRLSAGYAPVRNLLKGCAFHWGFTLWLGYYLNHPLYTPPYFANKQVIPSFLCFLFCEAGNFFINVALSRRNQAVNSTLHPLATGNPFTWPFLLVRYPQYTYEIGAWISLAVMTQAVPVAAFAALVSAQMLLWGTRRHRKHRRLAGRSGWMPEGELGGCTQCRRSPNTEAGGLCSRPCFPPLVDTEAVQMCAAAGGSQHV
ncbi:trans-2,3-enoyl-CoA reductase-like [Arapaima gigas]